MDQLNPLSAAFGSMKTESFSDRVVPERIPHRDERAPSSSDLPRQSNWLGEPIDVRQAAHVASQPVDYVAAPIFRAGRASLITGLGASSKSTLLKTLAVAVATGRGVLGMTIPQPGKAVLLLAEDTVEDAQRSLHAIFASMHLTPEEFELVRENLTLFALAGRDCVLVDPEEGSQADGRLQELLRMVKGMGDVRMIGLDPAIALTRGRELDELAQRSLANAVESLAIESGAAVVLVSHAAKSIQFQHEISSHASRGSGAITDAFRLEVVMRVMTSKEAQVYKVPEEDRHQYVKFQVSKANSLAPDLMRPKWFRRIEGGALALATLKAIASAQDRMRRAIELFVDTDDRTAQRTPISLDRASWKKKALEANLLTGSTQQARDMSASRLLSSLKDCGWVRDRDGLYGPTSDGLHASSRGLADSPELSSP